MAGSFVPGECPTRTLMYSVKNKESGDIVATSKDFHLCNDEKIRLNSEVGRVYQVSCFWEYVDLSEGEIEEYEGEDY